MAQFNIAPQVAQEWQATAFIVTAQDIASVEQNPETGVTELHLARADQPVEAIMPNDRQSTVIPREPLPVEGSVADVKAALEL